MKVKSLMRQGLVKVVKIAVNPHHQSSPELRHDFTMTYKILGEGGEGSEENVPRVGPQEKSVGNERVFFCKS